MRGWKRLTWGVLGAAAISGCATTPPRELVDARDAYQQASAGPAAQYSPDALGEAQLALDEANRAFAQTRDSERTRTLAYVALRKAQTAEARARTTLALEERRQAEQQLAMARGVEADRARRDLARARSELAEAQRLRAEAEQRQLEYQQQQEETARLQAEQQARETAQRTEQERLARIDELNTQLEQERQARLQAEQRATQAEADARAQTAVADELRNIRQVEVKEESRGLVLTLSGSVLFRSGSAELMGAAQQRLDEVADALKKADNPLVIEGHTDSQGSAQLNEELSYLRAAAVRNYLVSRGVEGTRIRINGMGSTQPIASNTTSEGRANNRRVEIVLQRGVGGAGAPAP